MPTAIILRVECHFSNAFELQAFAGSLLDRCNGDGYCKPAVLAIVALSSQQEVEQEVSVDNLWRASRQLQQSDPPSGSACFHNNLLATTKRTPSLTYTHSHSSPLGTFARIPQRCGPATEYMLNYILIATGAIRVRGAPPIVASGSRSIVYLWLCRYITGTPGICRARTSS